MEFEEIYRQYSPKIFRVCMAYINDYEQARDLVQETFIAVWKYLPSFRNQSAVSTWIYRIATNNCLQAIKKNQRIQISELPSEIHTLPEDEKQEKLTLLYTCISELEETDRIIISLMLEEVGQEEIADIIGLSYTNTRVRIHRIKEKLATKFKQHE